MTSDSLIWTSQMILNCLQKKQKIYNSWRLSLKKLPLRSLRIHSKKTKVMFVGSENNTTQVETRQQTVQTVDHFTYLGSLVCKSGDAEVGVTNRIGRAATLFRRMNHTWNASTISNKLKTRLYTTIVLPTALSALYG